MFCRDFGVLGLVGRVCGFWFSLVGGVGMSVVDSSVRVDVISGGRILSVGSRQYVVWDVEPSVAEPLVGRGRSGVRARDDLAVLSQLGVRSFRFWGSSPETFGSFVVLDGDEFVLTPGALKQVGEVMDREVVKFIENLPGFISSSLSKAVNGFLGVESSFGDFRVRSDSRLLGSILPMVESVLSGKHPVTLEPLEGVWSEAFGDELVRSLDGRVRGAALAEARSVFQRKFKEQLEKLVVDLVKRRVDEVVADLGRFRLRGLAAELENPELSGTEELLLERRVALGEFDQ